MRQDIKDYIYSCEVYVRVKPIRHTHGQLQLLPIPKGPWQDITVDFVTGLPASEVNGKKYDAIMVIVDRFTKMAHYVPIVTTLKAPELAEVYFREIRRLHGVLRSIVLDRGSIFISDYWREFIK